MLSENIINNSTSFYSYVKQRSKDKIWPLQNDRGGNNNDYFLSIFTKEDVENVPIPQQMFHGTENDKLLDLIIKKDMVHKRNREVK